MESAESGDLSFGGWIWRYDLTADGPEQAAVTLTYDWSGATPDARQVLDFLRSPPTI